MEGRDRGEKGEREGEVRKETGLKEGRERKRKVKRGEGGENK